MGIGPVGSSSDEEDSLETKSDVTKPLKGSPQTILNDSDVDSCSKGCGSASLLEAIESRRTQLKVPAACASQGAIDSLRIGLLLRQERTDGQGQEGKRGERR